MYWGSDALVAQIKGRSDPEQYLMSLALGDLSWVLYSPVCIAYSPHASVPQLQNIRTMILPSFMGI